MALPTALRQQVLRRCSNDHHTIDLSLACLELSLDLLVRPPSFTRDEKREEREEPPPLPSIPARSSTSTLLDWSALLAQLHFIVRHLPFHSLHDLARVLTAHLCASDALTPSVLCPSPIDHVTVELTLRLPPSIARHPDDHVRCSTAASELSAVQRERNAWGYVDVLAEVATPSCGLYLLHVEPQRAIPLHVHRVMNEAEMLLSSALECQGAPRAYGAVHRWGEAPHCYHNPTQAVHAVLCVDAPSFIRADEIEVEGEPAKDVASTVAGREVWHGLALGVDALSPSSSHVAESIPAPSFVFPGCYEGQLCELVVDPSRFQSAHAVLLLLFSDGDSEDDDSAPLLFVHHRERGWELPGGKVEDGEDEAHAAARELHEEAGVKLQPEQFTRIAQYRLTDHSPSGGAAHVKSVFAAVATASNRFEGTEWRETDDARMRRPPELGELRGSPSATTAWSPLLHDNVLGLTLQLARALRAVRRTPS